MLKGISYAQRFLKLNLTIVETRRLRDDLIQVLKIIKGVDDVNCRDYLIVASTDIQEDIVISYIRQL